MTTAIKYTPATLAKIENILKANDYTVRYEKGNFNSGYCVLESKRVIVVNKFYDTEARINCLIELIAGIQVNPDLLDQPEKTLFLQLQQKSLSL